MTGPKTEVDLAIFELRLALKRAKRALEKTAELVDADLPPVDMLEESIKQAVAEDRERDIEQ